MIFSKEWFEKHNNFIVWLRQNSPLRFFINKLLDVYFRNTLSFVIVYNKKNKKITSFIVPEHYYENNLIYTVKTTKKQSKIAIRMKEFNYDVNELQKLLNKKLQWQKSI